MSEPPKTAGLRGEIVRLGKGSFTYFVAMVVTRGLNLFLTPVYVRFMSPEEYGVVGFSSSLLPALAVLFGLGTHSAASRLYYSTPDDGRRERLVGTVLAFVLVVPALLGLVVEVLGSAGALPLFRSVPYSPYLRIIVWASVLIVIANTGLNMLVIREEHRRAAYFNSATVFLTAGFTVLLVVVLRKGAVGQLLAILLTNLVLAIYSVSFLWKMSRPVLDRPLMRSAVGTSLPLVPHELLKWGLAGSDRVILERNVSAAALGNYSLGYTFGNTVGMFSYAMIYAFMPMVNRKLGEGDPRNEVPPLGTIVILTSCFVALGAAVVLPPAIRLMAPPAYHGGAVVVPWVALALYFQALYNVWSTGTVFSRRTGSVALVTFIGAGTNIALNIILVPRYGIIAAAVTTAIGYALMAVLHAQLARKLFPIPWEYGRVARISLAAAIAYGASFVARGLGDIGQVLVGGLIAAVVFAALLALLRAIRVSELRRLVDIVRRRKAPATG